ncbi:MAG: glycerol-phosphatase [Nocardioidaceae bacterium]|nr:glycerol-phosphatase [Nocardioidaceae bacterium]
MLKTTATPLTATYDVAMLDLDGVVYVGPDAVPGAPAHLAEAAATGLRLAYVTNNASRSPDAVAAHLRELGVDVRDEDVVTSAQAAARLLRGRVPAGSSVFVIGGTGLEVALREQGLRPVQEPEPRPAAVVSGFSSELRWGVVIAGAILVRQGLPWVASNTDLTVPTPQGPGPGNGELVEVVRRFARRDPVVAGKPEAPLFEETLRRVGGQRPLVVGDRLDTDIAGARTVGYDSLLVMTGVTDAETLVGAPSELRPSYVAADLEALANPQPEVEIDGGGARSAGWTATVRHGVLTVEGTGDRHGWWRAVAVAGWRHLDTTGHAADVSKAHPPSSVVPDRAGR